MCLLTIPTVYLLLTGTLVALLRLVPSAKEWPIPVRTLVVVPVVVVLFTYVCLPPLSRAVAPWLFSSGPLSKLSTKDG
jgi:antibiotic biosynthesis monooxygenase (ABM) superfamily enzyme